MNLLQSDVFSARRILHDIGIDYGDVSCGWHDGEMSIKVKCTSEMKQQVLRVLAEKSSINIPIVVESDFYFNFSGTP